jgi:uncharacterized repeat protein (TIGR03803 family)
MRILRVLLCGASALLFASFACGQTVRELFSFSNANSSAGPATVTLVQGRDGGLYGTTYGDGRTVTTDGAVFKVSTAGGKFTALHAFASADGTNPQGGLTLGADGNYYGTTIIGGTSGAGTLFKVTPTGAFTALHQFASGSDGGSPFAPPIEAADGSLYGVTFEGNSDTNTNGNVFQYNPSSGLFTIILSLSQDGSQGLAVWAPLLEASDGTLYGTASQGGANGCGTIFNLTTSGTVLNVYSFTCGAGGSFPASALIQAVDGNFYGTTAEGGAFTKNGDCVFGCGTIFKLSGGVISTLYAFSGDPTDGASAIAGLVEGTDGELYGSTHWGGRDNVGTLYRISTSGQYQLLYSFVQRFGQYADGTLAQDTSGVFYGTTVKGGAYGEGSLYSLNMGLSPFIALVRYTGYIGRPVEILGQGLKGATAVTINGVPATSFKIVSNTYMTAVIPAGATTGPVVVTTSTGTLTSNHNLRIVQ